MTHLPTSPPVISPLPATTTRPQWSVMIPVYNCSQFLPETLRNVLTQGIPTEQMQIEVIDDASTDADVEALVREIGKGRITYYRQSHNVGSLKNFETAINRSVGKLVHLLHGDDYVQQGYYKKIGALFNEYPEAGAAFCNYQCVDEQGKLVYIKKPEMSNTGILPDWLQAIGTRQRTQYVAMTVKREVYEKLGSFFGIEYGEDWEMWVRIAKHYPVAYTPELLANYRKQSNSISSRKIITGVYLQELQMAMRFIQDHLPDDSKSVILKRSKEYFANYGLKVTKELWRQTKDEEIIKKQLQNVLQLSENSSIYCKIIYFQLLLMLNRLWHQG